MILCTLIIDFCVICKTNKVLISWYVHLQWSTKHLFWCCKHDFGKKHVDSSCPAKFVSRHYH
jgi:hypothetical protein